jgi:hypothetical protein
MLYIEVKSLISMQDISYIRKLVRPMRRVGSYFSISHIKTSLFILLTVAKAEVKIH